MMTLPNQGRFQNVLPLIRTLFDIALLRKGPDSIPRSGILLLMSLGLWALAAFTFATLIDNADGSDFRRELLNFVLAMICYYTVLVATGFASRITQTLTALIGCGALMALCFTAALVSIGQLAGSAVISMLAISSLIWSLSVEGHIIARAINLPFYFGVLIAFGIFVFQYVGLNLIMPKS
jgi:hypothetical protein